MLNSKIAEFNMTGAFSRMGMVDNLDGGVVVFPDGSRAVLRVGEFQKKES